jgi:hypothetical protein
MEQLLNRQNRWDSIDTFKHADEYGSIRLFTNSERRMNRENSYRTASHA